MPIGSGTLLRESSGVPLVPAYSANVEDTLANDLNRVQKAQATSQSCLLNSESFPGAADCFVQEYNIKECLSENLQHGTGKPRC